MNESILLRFNRGGQILAVADLSASRGVTFAKQHHPAVSPLNMGLGLTPLFPRLLDNLREPDGGFQLDATAADGGIRFSGARGNPLGLPIGVYDLAVDIEALRIEDPRPRVVVKSGKQAVVDLEVEPERRRIALRPGIDTLTQALLDASTVDGQGAMAWLASATPFAQRQACMLNVLAKLRVPQGKAKKVLTREFESVFFADVDRVYCVADPGLRPALEDLAASGHWAFEGVPGAPIHRNLARQVKAAGLEDPDEPMGLASFRQGGRNSLQVTIATPSHGRAVYTDVDIDLGNPLWDLEGLLVHLGELLNPGRTDHLSLHRQIDKGDTKDFTYYDVVEAAAAAAGRP
jgi:hypothetical protein